MHHATRQSVTASELKVRNALLDRLVSHPAARGCSRAVPGILIVQKGNPDTRRQHQGCLARNLTPDQVKGGGGQRVPVRFLQKLFVFLLEVGPLSHGCRLACTGERSISQSRSLRLQTGSRWVDVGCWWSWPCSPPRTSWAGVSDKRLSGHFWAAVPSSNPTLKPLSIQNDRSRSVLTWIGSKLRVDVDPLDTLRSSRSRAWLSSRACAPGGKFISRGCNRPPLSNRAPELFVVQDGAL